VERTPNSGSDGDKNQLSFKTVIAHNPRYKLIPFNRTKNEYYTVYWDVFYPVGMGSAAKAYDEQKKQQQELEARTTDILRVAKCSPNASNFAEKTDNRRRPSEKLRATDNAAISVRNES